MTRITLTNTALSTYRLCPRKYRNRYVLRLAHVRQATALRFGTAFHLGLELHSQQTDLTDLLQIVTASYDTCPRWADAVDWAVERETLRQLLIGHFWRYSEDNLGFACSEQVFELPLVNMITGRASRQFVLSGKIDAIVTLNDGRQALLEYKTAGEDIGPEREYWPRLRCDGQISLYVLAARMTGNDVATVLYDVTRKPTIRLRKDETPEQYSQRLCEDISARPDYYYQRREVPRLEDELREFQRELWQQACALRESMRHNRWYRNVSKMTCGFCEFSELCFNNACIDINSPPSGFMFLPDAHPELDKGEPK